MDKGLPREKKAECLAMALFAVAYIVITVFHEPWFDEAQAWQIAKCADLRALLFELPHLEGHPPLWHLILAIPAKLGVPFEPGLKTVGGLISLASAYLLLFRSRLPRAVRLLLPFSYFFFYQYGVVVRPYGLMLLCLLLLGMALPSRRERPWRTALLLGLLCLTSAYGLLFAGGIAACMVWELWREKGLAAMLRDLFRDPHMLSLLSLLLLALLLIAQIYPEQNAYAMQHSEGSSLPLRLFCVFFTFPVECFLSTSSWFSLDQLLLNAVKIPVAELIAYSLPGAAVWFVIVCAASKKTLKFLLVPYALFSVFSAVVYSSSHHLGLVFLLILFWAEFVSRSGESFETGKRLLKKLARTERDTRLLKSALMVVCAAGMVIPLYWSAAACLHDIEYAYYPSRQCARFIKEHGLEDALILCQWNSDGSTYPQSEGNEDYINTAIVGGAVTLSAYFPHNIALDLNDGRDDEAFIYHRLIDYAESRETAERWRKRGAPDLIIGHPDLKLVYGDTLSYDDYSLVYLSQTGFIWKNSVNKGDVLVYLRNELLDQYGLEAIRSNVFNYYYDGLTITDEMRERYLNGEPIEDILKPYLDAMFGPAK